MWGLELISALLEILLRCFYHKNSWIQFTIFPAFTANFSMPINFRDMSTTEQSHPRKLPWTLFSTRKISVCTTVTCSFSGWCPAMLCGPEHAPFNPTNCKINNLRLKFFVVQRAAMMALLTGWRMIKGLTRKFLSLLPKHICLYEPENRARESPHYTDTKTKLDRAWTSQVKAPVSGWAKTKSKPFPQRHLVHFIAYFYPQIYWPLFKNYFYFACMNDFFCLHVCICTPCMLMLSETRRGCQVTWN